MTQSRARSGEVALAPAPAGAGAQTHVRPGAAGLGWTLLTCLIAGLLSVPTLTVVAFAFVPPDEVWGHLASTVLPGYIANTAALLLGVGLGVLVVGVATAWLVAMCRFPGSRGFEWALLLPMAVPAYLMAYTYTDLFQFSGPVQGALRAAFGWTRRDYWFPQVRSLEGAIFVMTFVFYPYVYLLARAAFLDQSAGVLEASRSLGRGPWGTFLRVGLPLARPAIVGGLALALMEVLADFGAVQYFAVDTFTTGIYRTWFGLGSLPSAAQLAACLLLFVAGLLALERLSRGHVRYHEAGQRRAARPYRLGPLAAAGAIVACTLPVLFGFGVPAAGLVRLTLLGGDRRLATFPELALHSFTLAAVTAVVAVVLALLLAYALRFAPSRLTRFTTRLAVLGYAIPGSVVAIGVLVPFGWLDNTLDAWARAHLGVGTGLIFSGTLFALVFAYLVRFLAVAFNSAEAGLTRIKPSLDEAARGLGHGLLATLGRVHAPLLRGSLLTAALLVFVDVMKELPATLIVRPFNFDTLAVRVWRLAADERLAEASTPALAIVLVGLVPVILLSLAIARSRGGEAAP